MRDKRSRSQTITLRRPTTTSPAFSQALRTRLTECKVVPETSAISWRVTGKSTRTPSWTLRPDWLHEPKHGVGHAVLHVLSRHLLQPGMSLLNALSHHLHDVTRERRVTLHKVIPNGHVPGQRDAIDERRRSGRIIRAVERLGDAVDVAGNNEAYDHLLAVGSYLDDLQAAVEEHIERSRGLPLLEHGRALRNPERGGAADHVVELGSVHGGKYRQGLDQAAMEGRQCGSSGVTQERQSRGREPA